jgi:hypothetical protein
VIVLWMLELINDFGYMFYKLRLMAQKRLLGQGLNVEASRSHSDTPHPLGRTPLDE